MTRRISFAALVSVSLGWALALLGCGDAAMPAAAPAPAPAPTAPIVAAALPDAGPVEAPLPPGVPDTAAGHQLAWVLGAFAKPPSEMDVAPHFTPDFTSQIPIAQIVALFGKLGTDLAPIALDRVEPGPTTDRLSAVAHSEKAAKAATTPASGPADGPKMKIELAVEATEPHRIAGLTFRPVVEAKPAASWDEVQARLKGVAPSVGFLAAEITGGKCAAVSALEPKKALALGSTFKLYILDTLAKQIAAGKHKWDETVAVDEAKKSLPPATCGTRWPAGRSPSSSSPRR